MIGTDDDESEFVFDEPCEVTSESERAALGASLARGLAQADAGQLIDAEDVLAELLAADETIASETFR